MIFLSLSVVEYWSDGVVECWKKISSFQTITPVFQYSNTLILFKKKPTRGICLHFGDKAEIFVRPYTKNPLYGWQTDILGQIDPWGFDNGEE